MIASLMINFSNKIPQLINAQLFGRPFDGQIENISIDSRSLQNDSKTLFFALVGKNNNSHIYIEQLIKKGVKNFVVSQIPNQLKTKACFFLVENTLTALQNFATNYRSQFHFPIIGITGSNGKTIVKEWLNFLLSPDYNIIRSPKSYNSQVGVPLSILGINQNHNFGIFEAGISTISEMQNLQKIINPTIGILTNIGTAHDEGFENTIQKITEKLKLFENSEVIICQKNKTIDNILSNSKKLFTWSFVDKTAAVFIEKKTNLIVNYNNKTFEITSIFKDAASIENTISCLMVMLYLKYNFETIQTRLSFLFPVEMRLEVKNGINNTTLIDDSYNSDFQSLKIVLDFLENQKQHQKKTLILSDIYQSGLSDLELYTRISDLIIANKIDRIIGVGKTISGLKNSIHFDTTTDFLNHFETLKFENETILIKGARAFEFEKIVSLLEQKTHETVLEINLNAISHNLNYYKHKLKPTTKTMVMVKAFGYGNGGFEIAKLLEYHKVDYLGVAFSDEGIALKTAGINLPIMVLNPESTSFDSIIQHQLEPEIYSIRGLNSFIKITKQKTISHYPIHLKINTGMNRLGFDEKDIPEVISILKENKSVEVKSILSHLATSDNLKNQDFANKQIQLFEKLSINLMDELKIKPIRHILNTSGISNFLDAQFDMVRLGIGLYGISNDENEQQFLETVGTLKSVISQIRTIAIGESVGYSQRFIATTPTIIATIPIGYADGINRHLGNEIGFVNINNKKAPIVGSICMDMLMVNITGIDCNEGDSVIIFGENPSVIEISKLLQTIPYEILTGISQRVKRIFYRE